MESIIYLKSNCLLSHQWEESLKEILPKENIISAQVHQYRTLSHRIKPKLVILDIRSLENVSEIINYFTARKAKVAVLLMDEDEETIKQLFLSNLTGYLVKDMELSEIKLACDMMLNGEIYIHPKLSQAFLSDYIRLSNKRRQRPNDILTEREWEILELIVKGKKTKEMSELLYISTKTVANHISSIYRKLNVRDRVGAVIVAVKEGWFVL